MHVFISFIDKVMHRLNFVGFIFSVISLASYVLFVLFFLLFKGCVKFKYGIIVTNLDQCKQSKRICTYNLNKSCG